jgi:hypothetical protein
MFARVVEDVTLPNVAYLVGDKPLNVYEAGDAVTATATAEAPHDAPLEVMWEVSDYFGNTVVSASDALAPGETTVSRNFGALEKGHYQINAWVRGKLIKKWDFFCVVAPLATRPQVLEPDVNYPANIDPTIWLPETTNYSDTNKVAFWHVHEDPNYVLPQDANSTYFNGRPVQLAFMADWARAIRLTGAQTAEFRVSGSSLDPGQYQNPVNIMTALSNAGMRVSGVISNTPAYPYFSNPPKNGADPALQDEAQTWFNAGTAEQQYKDRKSYDLLPNRMDLAYDWMKGVAASLSGVIRSWVIFNEPESSGGIGATTGPGEYADRCAATTKTLYIAIKDAAPGTPVINGGLMYAADDTGLDTSGYQSNLQKNGFLRYADIWNFHNHLANADPRNESDYTRTHYEFIRDNPENRIPVVKSQGLLDKKALFEADEGAGRDRPAWCMEAGGGIAHSPFGLDGDYVKQRWQARYLVTSFVINLSLGVDSNYFFSGGIQTESLVMGVYPNDRWGLTSPRRTYAGPRMAHAVCYAAMPAMAAMTKALGKAVYLGRWVGATEVGAPAPHTDVHFFQNGTKTVAAMWANGGANVTLDLGKASATLTDIMGRETAVSAGAGGFTVTLTADPQYLTVEGGIPGAAYVPAGFTRREFQDTPLTVAERVVVDQIYPLDCRKHDTRPAPANGATPARPGGYRVSATGVTAVTANVYNFNPVAVTVDVAASIDAAHAGDYAVAGGPFEGVSIPAWGKASFLFQTLCLPDCDGSAAELAVTCAVAGEGMAAPSVTAFYREP